ncbi:43305_t:CDS:2 [Gigaspora margarita]|uniref:43305_t:CDS:1 n=1 Tax=Gigaspora margarita TaxID=4874 RepID=A0ABM8VY91_GIGMA|nr:43305_t:CDS:2 [Gigaspora margarita]
MLRKINSNNDPKDLKPTTEATIEKNNKYQEYQEYLKAKQVYLASIQDYKPRKKETSNFKTY